MTIAQQLEQRGMQQGLQEGMQQGMQQGLKQGIQQEKYIIAKNMILEHLELHLIARTTGLSVEEIVALQKELEKESRH